MTRRRAAEPAAEPDSALRRAGLLGCVATAALLALYLAFPETVFVFDGIMFSAIIERAVDEWRAELFNRRHLLFNPLMMGLRDLLARLDMEVGGYILIQRANAVLGAAGILVFFAALRRLGLAGAPAFAAAAALAVSRAYWARAVEGQVYMSMSLGALVILWAAAGLLERASARRAWALAAALAGAMLVHAANLALIPGAALAVFFAARRAGERRLWWALPAGAAAVAVPYLALFRIDGPAALLAFLTQASESFSPQGAGGLAGLSERFLGGMGGFERALYCARHAGLALLAAGSPALALSAGLGLAAAGAASLWLLSFDTERRERAWVLAALGLGMAGLDAFWRGGVFFWAPPLACLLGLIALAWERRLPPRLAAGALGALAAALLAWNGLRGAVPDSKLENNVGHRRALFVRDHTVGSSWVLISGLGFPNSKVYLPYFARRSREVLEYYLDRNPKEQALAKFKAFVARNLEFGIPLYLLSDLVEDPVVLSELGRAWGVTRQDLSAALGPGRALLMAEQDPGFRVFLWIPDENPERLFAALGYSILVDSAGPRLRESAHALKLLAARMSPAQRRATLRLMKDSRYGSELLWRGFFGYMGPESRAAAKVRLDNFDAWMEKPEFKLRLGNLCSYLGAAAETRRLWTEAYEATRDPKIKAEISKLPQ